MGDVYLTGHGGFDVLDERAQEIASQESVELLSGQLDGSNNGAGHPHGVSSTMAANPMPMMTMETMVATNAVPAYALNVAHLPHQRSFVSTAPATPAVPGCYCHVCLYGGCPPPVGTVHGIPNMHLATPAVMTAGNGHHQPLPLRVATGPYSIRPAPSARSVPTTHSGRQKRSLEQSLSVSSSSSDDEISVTAHDSHIIASNKENSRKSGLRNKKALRIQPPSSPQPVDAGSTETIDIASSDDDDNTAIIDPTDDNGEVDVHNGQSSAHCNLVSSHVDPPGQSCSNNDHLQQQSCPHAHCTCHLQPPPHCTCNQWPPMCPAAHHYHHHSCQLHSPCPNHCPMGTPNQPQPSSSTWWYQQNVQRQQNHRAPVVHQSRRSNTASSHQPPQTHQYRGNRNQRSTPASNQSSSNMRIPVPPRQELMGVPMYQQTLYNNQQAQMERQRQAQSQFFASRQRQHYASANHSPVVSYVNVMPPTDGRMFEWSTAAMAPSADPLRRTVPFAPSPFQLAYVTPPTAQPRNAAFFNQIQASTAAVLAHALPHTLPVEIGMFVHGSIAPIALLGGGFEGTVFPAPSAEPQPIGASRELISQYTKVASYEKEDAPPAGEEERCTVCLSEFEAKEHIRTLQCEHLFHVDCIDRWLTYNKKCPVCRVDLDRNSQQTQANSRHGLAF